jgi:uncharacterized protein
MEQGLSILVTGTTGAGKSTVLRALSEVPAAPEPSLADWSAGHFALDDGRRVRLLETPSQRRFDFGWPQIARGSLGLLILVDNTRPEPLADLGVFLEGFHDELARLPCVIGVGRTEECSAPDLDEYADYLAGHELVLPVLAVDVRQREDVMLMLDALLAQHEAGFDADGVN